jgi:hypothetical protein
VSKRPVIICTIKQIPRIDPIFHQNEIDEGVGNLINEL